MVLLRDGIGWLIGAGVRGLHRLCGFFFFFCERVRTVFGGFERRTVRDSRERRRLESEVKDLREGEDFICGMVRQGE